MSAKEGIDQRACAYTPQGFEFDDVGVIVGHDLVYRPMDGGWALAAPEVLASSIVDVLLNRPRTRQKMLNSLVHALEAASSWAESKILAAKLERLTGLEAPHLDRIEKSIADNPEVRNAFGVPERLRALLAANR